MVASRPTCRVVFLGFICASLLLAASAEAALTVEPITWNIIGLDSNSPLTGPNRFPVGARVCSNIATTNVAVNFVWDSANSFIDLRGGSLSTITIPSIAAGTCEDAYFEVEVVRDGAAFDTTRRYHITATDGTGTTSTTTPREVYVEHLISQSRNSISEVKYGPNPGSLTSVAPGGGMALVVGNTYTIQLLGGTATQGYNQFEAFINFPNTIFQILDVATTYSANNSPYVTGPAPAIHDRLYADACGWENDPNSPNYRDCVGGDFKSGGSTVITTYTIKIVSGGGTSQPLNTLLYDFSGSSFHYNADFSTGARIANIIDPTAATISKSFSPATTVPNGVSALTITLTNPNSASVSGYNFVDNLPANVQVASTPSATTSGCGTPTLTATGGSSSITFSNGTVAANGSCLITVNVTPATTGTFTNTTNSLFIDTIDTGKTATADLTASTDTPGSGFCGTVLARWNFPTGFNTTTPAATIANVTATASAGAGLTPVAGSVDNTITPAGTISWRTNGGVAPGTPLDTTNNDYFEFAINTTGVTSLVMSFDALRTQNGAKGLAVYFGTSPTAPGTLKASLGDTALTTQTTWFSFGAPALTFNSGLNPAGTTYFRIYAYNSNNDNPGADFSIDNVLFTSCTTAVKPTMTKAFSPNPIAVNGTSTLTFTLTNTNTTALTGAKFIDTLPTGVQVAATPAAATTCTGAPTWAPAAAATTLSFGQTTAATIPASGSCTVSVNVTATTAGPHTNVSGFLSTTESGTSTGSVATASLTAVSPPSIAKAFAPSPIIPGAISTLTFTITNPNSNNGLTSVAFTDVFPTSPGAMVVAPTPNASTAGCGAPTFSPAAGASSITFSGGTITAGGTCTVKVNITAPTVGTYANTSGNVSHVVNAQTINGNTAAASLVVNPPNPTIGLLKQISTSASGPWTSFLALSAGPVFYRFTVENTGDVPLTSINITDDTLNVASCNATFAAVTLPVAVAANDNHIVTCVVGPVATSSGTHTNTATAHGTFNAVPHDSPTSDATYATTALTLDKNVAEGSFTSVGDLLHYSYLVTNSGFAPLIGPVAVADDKASATCPAVSTIGDLDNFLEPGESITCTAIYTIVAGDITAGFVTNVASASAQSVASPSDSVTVFSSTSADVSIVKTLTTTGPFFIGQPVSYTLVVANGGPATATGIDVTDTPANLTITNVTGACAALPCVIASLASGANTVVNVTATITGATFDNSATAIPDQVDPDPADNTDNTDNGGTATFLADISLVKTLTTSGPFTPGQTIAYTIVVSNAGPSTATSIDITDAASNISFTTVTGGGCSGFPCTIANIASGASVTINATATINGVGPFDNAATGIADEPDPNLDNNTDATDNGGMATSADVSMVKTLTSSPPFAIGQTITYTLTVANAGPSTATGIDVTDVPSNLNITSVSGACAALPCTIASLGIAQTTINVSATIVAIGAFDNSAAAMADEPDPNLTNNTDNVDNGGIAVASADVSLVKTLTSTGPFTIGQTITYTLVVANAGPSTATNIDVTDVPSNLTLGAISGACATLPCTIASLASGTNTTITVNATIVATGAFDNSASAMADEFDPNTANNTDNVDNGGTAGPSADVSLVKTLITSGPYVIGQTITYTLLIANAGPSTATSIDVTDVPANLTIGTISGACAALPCTIPSLASGANTTINVNATIVATGAFDNSANATADEFDPNTTNNTDNVDNDGTADPSADVSLVKTLTTSPPYVIGQTITYTLVVGNAGPSTATGIDVTDVPSNLIIGTVSGACAALPCTIATLAPGADATITVNATIVATGTFDNSATALGDEFDPNTANNTDTVDNNGTAAPSADVSLVKTLTTPPPYVIGQTITYTLLIANAGPSMATSIDVSDVASNLTIGTVSGACAALPCTIASLASGADTTISVNATIVATGAFDNSANATADEFDPNTTNNTDNVDNNGTAAGSADVSLVKTLTTSPPYFIGQTITYLLFIANAGPSTATNIDVTDVPSNLTLGTISGACATLPCTIASLASGANTTINVSATIDATGAFDNSANATADEFDPNTVNNTDSVDNDGTAAASADVSLVKTLITAGPYVIGQTISYSLLIANAGPSTATSIDVTDVPSNLTLGTISGACATLPCTIASLASGANTTINVSATITATGAFDNSANATADEFDPNTANNTDNVDNNGTAAASADVSLVKTLTTSPPYVIGQTITYTLFIANAGPSTATNIDVTDVPSNLTLGTISGACATLPCTIASLASGANATINVSATITATGAFDNSANATADEFDPNTVNNTDNVDNNGTAGGSADVSLVKTLTTSPPFVIGQTINYSLLIANAGPSTATNIDVTDAPSNLTLGTISGACATLPCTISSLASGANTTINVSATIDATGAFDNSGNATGDEFDPNTANNTDNVENNGTAGPSADVSIVKTLTTSAPYVIGQTITYTLFVANAGPSTATSIDVTDVPSNLTIGTVNGACATLPCTIATLAAGANTSINVSATINATGAFDNSANATADEFDPNTANNTDNVENNGTAGPSADVSIVKTLTSTGVFRIGQTINYTLVIANAGPSTATGIDVIDVPSNLTLGTVSGACAALPCTIASLASGADATINVTATIVATGAFDNSATATADEFDPDTENNTDDNDNQGTAVAAADVSIVKTLTTLPPYVIGQTIAYSLLVANDGPSTATNIDVTDLPSNLTIGPVSGACAALPCTIASLASGANTTINISATIGATGAFDNSATALGDELDPDSENNTDSTANNAGPSADISVVKTLSTTGAFSIGQTISYTLVVHNAGPSTATSIDVTDVPSNLTLGTVTGACGTLPCTIASLASGADATINVSATIDAAGPFDNSATGTAEEFDPNTNNNTDNTGNNGIVGPSADVSMVKTLTTAGPFTAGQPILYTLLISNAGPSTATSIDVTDTPSNLTVSSVTGACVALPCTIATLASGANTMINVTATINAIGPFDNSASAIADEPDPDPTDNTDDTENDGVVGPSADVSLVKTLTTAGPFSVGQAITYTLEVANAGPSAATSVDVTDTPSNLTISSVSGACAALPCTIASLTSGASTTIDVTATISSVGTFDNSATATADEPDPDGSDNTDDTENNGVVGPSADVSLVKTLTTAGPFSVGQAITYTLEVANTGPSAATSVDISDTPSNLTITNVSGACAALPCTIASLASGASTSITVIATINATGAFDNSASAFADEPDPNTVNNTDDTENNGIVGVSADVSLVKRLATASPFGMGQAVTYTLLIHNAGPSTATNIDVTDTPSNLSISSVTGACAVLPCTIATLAVGADATITVVATINALGAFDNSATALADEPDPNTNNNTDSTENNGVATPVVDLVVTKTSSAPLLFVGQTFHYTVVVTNNGPDTATAVVLTDPLPAHFALSSATTTQGTCTGTTTVTCTIGTMLDNASVTITITGRATAAGTLTNTATAAANEAETVMTNNSSSAAPVVSAVGADIPTASELALTMLALLLAMAGAVVIRTR
jgi:uncharacterized repeat protein (TIGR01451 family)